jgi:hypothetical protein
MRRVVLLVLTVTLSACNLGGGTGSDFTSSSSSSSGSSSGVNADPEGIWTGADSISGMPVIAIVEESGAFDIIRNDGAQFTGQVVVSGTSFVANDQGFAQVGGTLNAPFTNGATYGVGSLSGVLAAGVSITASTSFTPIGGTAIAGTLSLNFDSLYTTGSSFAAISGNYTNQTTGDTVSISGSGVIFSQNSVTSCVLNGQISLINASYDAYGVSYTYSNCGTGAYLPLIGVQLAGLGVLNSTASPVQLIIGVTGSAGAAQYGDVLQLTHQ